MKLIAFSFLMMLASVVQAQKTYELSVKEAVDLAYQNVIDIKNAQVDYRIQQAKNKEIEGQALPQISGSISGNHYVKLPTILFPQSDQSIYDVLARENLIPAGTKAPPPTFAAFSFQQPWNFAMGATLQQLLFQPDVFVGLQARKTALDYSETLVEQAKEKIKDSAYKRYYAILIAEKQLYFLEQSLNRLEKLAHDDSAMYKNGFIEKLDLDKVQVQLTNLRTNRDWVKNAVDLSYAALKFALGISQKDIVILKDDLTVENLKEGILDESFKYEDRVEMRTLNRLQDLQKLDIKRNKFGYLPTVALAANYSDNGMGQKFFTDKSTFWFKSAYIGLNVNVPIFSGFQRKYKVQESELTLEKLNNSVENLKQAIDFEQVVNKQSLLNALLTLDIQEKNMKLAEQVFHSTELKRQQGVGSSFEVLQADTEYQNAQANYFTALYNAVVAKISYQAALGKLQ